MIKLNPDQHFSPFRLANLSRLLLTFFKLDTGAGGRGKLTIMDVETKKFWQSDLVSTLYPCITAKN